MQNRAIFVCLLRATRAGFMEQMLPKEELAMKDHVAYLERLKQETTFYLIGSCLDRTYGISIFEADSLEDAQQMITHDPSVERGVMSFEVHPFHISYWRQAEV
jgi:uncharacterized protein YciI